MASCESCSDWMFLVSWRLIGPCLCVPSFHLLLFMCFRLNCSSNFPVCYSCSSFLLIVTWHSQSATRLHVVFAVIYLLFIFSALTYEPHWRSCDAALLYEAPLHDNVYGWKHVNLAAFWLPICTRTAFVALENGTIRKRAPECEDLKTSRSPCWWENATFWKRSCALSLHSL